LLQLSWTSISVCAHRQPNSAALLFPVLQLCFGESCFLGWRCSRDMADASSRSDSPSFLWLTAHYLESSCWASSPDALVRMALLQVWLVDWQSIFISGSAPITSQAGRASELPILGWLRLEPS